MTRETFYEPTTGGYERAITERLRHWQQLRSDREAANDTTTALTAQQPQTTPDQKDPLA
jgi:putative ATPase